MIMKPFCLMPSEADKLKQAIIKGDINPETLSKMSSEDTEKYLARFLNPEDAKQVNLLYEKKLLLKNQERAVYNLFRDLSGLSEAEKLAKAKAMNEELLRKKARLFNPTENEKVLSSLINDNLSKKYKVDISTEEANEIIRLSNNIDKSANYSGIIERTKHGRDIIALHDYVNQISGKKAGIIKNVLGLPRAVMATLDLSAPLNQGWGMISRPEFYKNLRTMFKAARKESYFRDVQAEILTRDTYKGAKRAGLRISDLGENLEQREEVFMTTLLDKIPGIKGSQRAYTAFLNKLRMDVYDNMVKKAMKAGEDVSVGSKALEDIANSVNIFTGGYGKTNAVLNATVFSPRKVQSSLQMLNPMTYINPKTSKTARMASLRNIIGSLGITAGMIGTAKLLGGDKVKYETDRTSSDFGKIIIGDARIDVSGGNAGYITLVSRVLPDFLGGGKTKSSQTGITKKLGEGFGSEDKFSLITKFGRNKLSPIASLFVDLSMGENSIGEKKTPTQSVIDRFKPMFANNMYELWKSDTSFRPIITALALFGANVSIYGIGENWESKDTQEIIQFKAAVTPDQFKEANDKYNKIIEEKIKAIRDSEEYKNMSDDDKANVILKIKTDAKKEVFKDYGFKKRSLPSKK